MGREIRRVPADWKHPKNHKGHFQPMYDCIWQDDMHSWIDDYGDEFLEWSKDEIEAPPDPNFYRPAFRDKPTAFQIYENVTEGTPVSPVFATQDEMRQWLLAQGHSEKATDEFIELGFAFSFVYKAGELKSNIDTLG